MFPDAGIVGEAETFWRSSRNRPGHPNDICPSLDDCLQFRRCRKATKRFIARFFPKNPRISPVTSSVEMSALPSADNPLYP